MTRYLLLGAGFSHNWGGWLATEVFEYLLGDPAVRDDPELRALLWQQQPRGGFEYALAELKSNAPRDPGRFSPRLRSLEAAVRRMFDEMNGSFRHRGLEFSEHFTGAGRMHGFLRSFDAIFTLNQDLLLERCYRGGRDGGLVNIEDWRTERDWTFPGMRPLLIPGAAPYFPSATGPWVPAAEFEVRAGVQPIFKLHGSSNWSTTDGHSVMILGGGKASAIERLPILARYAVWFKEALSGADVRLMVIGYGFRDEHINEILQVAMAAGLRTFVIDPRGADAAASTNSLLPTQVGYKLSPFEEQWRTSLIGASRRPLASTFGSDTTEYSKIRRFLSSESLLLQR